MQVSPDLWIDKLFARPHRRPILIPLKFAIAKTRGVA